MALTRISKRVPEQGADVGPDTRGLPGPCKRSDTRIPEALLQVSTSMPKSPTERNVLGAAECDSAVGNAVKSAEKLV